MPPTLPAFALALIDAPQSGDAVPGMSYPVTIERQIRYPFVGRLGEARIGSVAVQIRRAEPGERYEVAVTAVRRNRFAGRMQAACRWRRRSDRRTGGCNMPPG